MKSKDLQIISNNLGNDSLDTFLNIVAQITLVPVAPATSASPLRHRIVIDARDISWQIATYIMRTVFFCFHVVTLLNKPLFSKFNQFNLIHPSIHPSINQSINQKSTTSRKCISQMPKVF